MTIDFRSIHDFPLASRDLQMCQDVFDIICEEQSIPKDSEGAQDLAALIIELYRQGIHDIQQLHHLVGAAGGARNVE